MRFEKLPRRGRYDAGHAEHPDGAWAFKGGRPGDVRGSRPRTGRLGVTIQELEAQLAEYFGTSKGVLVNSVTADSPAARAGLKAGDVVTAVNGKAVAEPSELIEAVQAVEDGATLTHRLHARQEGAVDQGDAREEGAGRAAAEAAERAADLGRRCFSRAISLTDRAPTWRPGRPDRLADFGHRRHDGRELRGENRGQRTDVFAHLAAVGATRPPARRRSRRP